MHSNQNLPEEVMRASRQRLADCIAHWTTAAELVEPPIPGLAFYHFKAPTVPVSSLHKPSICLVVQGSKRVRLNEEDYVYDANQYLFTSVTLPIIANITAATPETPFLGLTWTLDLRMAAQLIADNDVPPLPATCTGRGAALGASTPALLQTLSRLVDLLETPEDIPVLAPLLHKEFLYRLLTGDQGDRLRQIAHAEGHSQQISKAIDWLLGHYCEPVRMEDLAAHVGMSPSTFHHHFRAVTAMSPLQFQKWLRLQEARRLMLSENKDAASAASLVGYESPSQFSREYSRQFGDSPKRDMKRLQGAPS